MASDLEFDGMVAQCSTTRPGKRVQRCQRLPEEATRCPDVKQTFEHKSGILEQIHVWQPTHIAYV